jgi:alkanesulfonate monooxygenase SsuD/methylene tetrahydromethanopterin reductase-like flavin-dependent oxidoreductase (luciferase family)
MSRTRDLEASLSAIKNRFGKLNPPPVRGMVPILIGGGGEKVMLRVVAEHADIWNWFGEPDDFRRRNAVLDEWCASVGRDPAAIERSANIRRHQVANAEGYLEAGVTHLIVGLGGPDLDLSPLAELLAWRDAHV